MLSLNRNGVLRKWNVVYLGQEFVANNRSKRSLSLIISSFCTVCKMPGCRPRRIFKCAVLFSIPFTVYVIISTLFAGSSYHQIRSGLIENFGSPDDPSDALVTSPFVSGEPKLVVLLSYQRSGSSFVGEWFNTNPEVFFSFEPVDSLYSAMYGTKQNQNVPSDINNYKNGTLRQLPDEEVEAVADFLRNYLTCDADSVPTQTLLNVYAISTYTHLSSANYTNCTKRWLGNMYLVCEHYTVKFCGLRFGAVNEDRQKECFRRLWTNKTEMNQSRFVGSDSDFDRYHRCISYLRQMVKTKCLPLLVDSCRNRSIRVIKTVRATMASMRPLLESIPNFRVIHLVRDPRAVALSREKFRGHVVGLYAGNSSGTISKEAKLYCNTVVRDIKIRKELERKYPGKIYPLLFEELAANNTLFLSNVYKFLDAKPSNLTERWLMAEERKNKAKNISSNEIINRWQNEVSFRTNKEIVESCEEFYRITKFNWVM